MGGEDRRDLDTGGRGKVGGGGGGADRCLLQYSREMGQYLV